MNQGAEQYDIAICGGGMIGLTAACLFLKQGLKIAVLDQSNFQPWDSKQITPRVSALNIASINLLKYLDAWDTIKENRISPYVRMQVWEHGTNQNILFDAADFNLPYLGCIVENNLIVDVLMQRLKNSYGASIFSGTSLSELNHTDNEINLLNDQGENIHCSLLVGADGSESKVRSLSQIDTQKFDYRQEAIVTTVTLSESHQETAWQAFTETGPIALLPLEDGRCSIVWSCEKDRAKTLMALSDESFCQELSCHFNNRPAQIVGCDKRLSFPLRQHHTETYLSKNIVLVGDAAHITHPLAGLGANIGLMDAASLSQVLEQARANNLEISRHSVLRRYERWRKGENSLVLNLMKGFNDVFSNPSAPLKSIRSSGLGIANQITPLKKQLAQYAMGINGDLPDSCISNAN